MRPLFSTARWIEEHHATIDKDYVVVKLMDGIDEHVAGALSGLPINHGDGIPWFAFTEPDGSVLAISRGPLGNIGFPSSLEGIRHFRGCFEATVKSITPAELNQLIDSLGTKAAR